MVPWWLVPMLAELLGEIVTPTMPPVALADAEVELLCSIGSMPHPVPLGNKRPGEGARRDPVGDVQLIHRGEGSGRGLNRTSRARATVTSLLR